MKLAIFLSVAIGIVLSVMGSLARLLPQLGVEGPASSMISGAVSGTLIVLLHGGMFKPSGS